MTGPVLIYADHAGQLAANLRPRLPGEIIHAVNRPDAFAAALETLRPEVVFSINSPSLGGTTHRPILDARSVRWLHVGGSGYEHVLGWDAARLTVTNCAEVLAPFLAETVFGALLAMNSELIRYHEQQRDRVWRQHLFRPLSGQTLLVVGVGAIGAEVAGRASAMGMRVIGLRRSTEPVPGVDEMRPPDALTASLAEADAVSLHLRLTPETKNLFDARMFAAMKPGAIFINTARGGHVVENDLLAALQSGHLRGAYLDVFQTEPLPANSPLWAAPNLLISPHTADGVIDWEARFAALFAENLESWRAGRRLRNLVAG
ncbi:MAG TPA: D-2-hydroxyacid dehydrogenase [Thermohalobaculum sp.]|nr:D-2-hydroxyacid dehydrogenase [Thermohalobaculum sp.]